MSFQPFTSLPDSHRFTTTTLLFVFSCQISFCLQSNLKFSSIRSHCAQPFSCQRAWLSLGAGPHWSQTNCCYSQCDDLPAAHISCLELSDCSLWPVTEDSVKTVSRCFYVPRQSGDIYLSEWSLLQLRLYVSCLTSYFFNSRWKWKWKSDFTPVFTGQNELLTWV